MSRFNPDKLTVEYRPSVTPVGPVIPRRYTLTHSDVTAELFLTIGISFAYDKIGPMRDEVLSEWVVNYNNLPYLFVYLDVDGSGSGNPYTRNFIFRRELPLALEAIRYGDRYLFDTHPMLDNAQIWVWFISSQPTLNRLEYWGNPFDYFI